LLIDDDDAGIERGARSGEVGRLAVEHDRTGIGEFRPAEYFHERALAGAVLSDDAENFTPGKFERNVVERSNRTVSFYDPVHREERSGHWDLLTSSPHNPYAFASAPSTFALVNNKCGQ